MSDFASTVGFVVIVILYASVGVLAGCRSRGSQHNAVFLAGLAS